MAKECKDCWHNYHCPMPQEGYNFDPDTCQYNPDNEMKKNDKEKFPEVVALLEKMKEFEKHIFNFDRDDENANFVPMTFKPKEEGTYLTIRCGLGGIYTAFNEWKDGQWQCGICDASQVIAYSRNLKNEIFK